MFGSAGREGTRGRVRAESPGPCAAHRRDSGYACSVSTELPADLQRAESLIRDVPGFPKPGIVFRDIAPLLADGPALHATAAALVEPFRGRFDVVAGVEARGFILGTAAAAVEGVGFVPVRKAGKLPRPAASEDFALEYGTATIEVHDDLPRGTRVLLVDDVLATGGTLAAGRRLLARVGYEVVGTAVLFEIDELGGRAVVGDEHLHTVFRG